MKTFYFSGYWEEPWECGDGCCTGGGDWLIDLDCVKEGEETLPDTPYFGTCFSEVDVLISVYEHVYGEHVPDNVFDTWDTAAERWLTQKLKERDVFVVIDIEGETE
jgi:hypothetical protein